MFELLKSMLTGRSDIASGGLLLMIIGALSVYLRAVPVAIWHWFVEQMTMTVTVTDDDAAFVWVKEWFLAQKFLRRVRHVDLDTTLRNELIAMIPAPGKHWFWYRGRSFAVWFSRVESTHERISRRTESLTFRTLGRDRAFLKVFVDDIVSCHLKRLESVSYLYTYNDGWELVEGYAARSLGSVVLEPGETERLVRDVERFRNSKNKYRLLGIPYHRGYLFYGPPGTGKTSLVSALAGHFGLSIYTINLTDMSDRSLTVAVNQVPAHPVLLFEDIDCMRGSQSRSARGTDGNSSGTPAAHQDAALNGVTLSGLLNVLDGFNAPTGVLFVMTTNHFERLDGALLRAGRIDYRLYLGLASHHQKVELYRRFFPQASEREAREFVEASASAATMAEFQGVLLSLEKAARDRLDGRGSGEGGTPTSRCVNAGVDS